MWAAWLALSLELGTVCVAHAQDVDPAGVTVTVDPCVPVDTEQFHRVLAIELGTSIDYRASASAQPGSTWVHLSCTELGIELRLDDGITRKSMVRTLDAQRIEAGSRTRLLALAVAEFVVASWVELRISDKPAVAPVGPEPPSAARNVAEGVVHKRTTIAPALSEPVPPPPSAAKNSDVDQWQLSALFRLEGWSSQPGVLPVVGLRVGERPAGNFAFMLGADFGVTRAGVAQGQVDLTMGSLLGALLFATSTKNFDLYAGGGGRFGFVRMHGVSRQADVVGRSFAAPYGGPLILARLSYRVSRSFHIFAEGEAGLVTLSVQGYLLKSLVLEINGAWVSAGLGVSWAF